jgi:hypothetical protein
VSRPHGSGRPRRPVAEPLSGRPGDPPATDRAPVTGPTPTARDREHDSHTMMRIVAILGAALAISASLQAVLVLGVQSETMRGADAAPLMDVGRRVLINLAVVVVSVLLAERLRIEQHRAPASLWLVAAAGATVGGVRAIMQLSTGIYSQEQWSSVLIDAAMASILISLIFAFALSVTRSQQRLRAAERRTVLPAAIAADALLRMQRAELRDRQTDADALRSSERGRIEAIRADLEDLAARADASDRVRLASVLDELDALRRAGKRGLEAAIYPREIGNGLVPALRALVARVPAPIEVKLRMDAAISATEGTGNGPLGLEKRLLLMRLADEGIANALRHGYAQQIEVSLSLENSRVRMIVADRGIGVRLPADLRSLGKLRTRIELAGGRVYLGTQPGGGTRLAAIMPVAAARGPRHPAAGPGATSVPLA